MVNTLLTGISFALFYLSKSRCALDFSARLKTVTNLIAKPIRLTSIYHDKESTHEF